MMRWSRYLAVLLAVFSLLQAMTGQAGAGITLDASGRGWIDSRENPNGNATDDNYFVGFDDSYRNHFDFDIPTLAGVLTSAVLYLDNPSSPNSGHKGGTHTYTLSSVGAFGTYGFADIGTGTVFGSVDISGTGTIAITLNAAAFAAITAAQGGTFSLGGVLTNLDSSVYYDFAYSYGEFKTRLVLETRESVDPTVGVPEPSTFAMAGSCLLAGLVALRRRK